MESDALDHFDKFKSSTIPMEQINYLLSYESYQDDSTTAMNLCIIIHFLPYKRFIDQVLATVADHTDSCTNQYPWASTVYILYCIALEFIIIINRAVGASGNGKDVVDGIIYGKNGFSNKK